MKYCLGIAIVFFTVILFFTGGKIAQANDKIKILIVPGHDNESAGGTQFRGMKEADLNLLVASKIFKLFDVDPKFQAFITRDQKGYKPEFSNYFSENRSDILLFRDWTKSIMSGLIAQGVVKQSAFSYHNFASDEDSIKLYGINKWANDNKIDVVVHAHFNDYRGRPENKIGKYSGFSVYIPEKQLLNYEESFAIAQSVFNQLKKYYPISNLPAEKTGILEDQELIAIGSNASLASASFLIEYDYIYESQLSNSVIQPLITKELAYQTYKGIKTYFASTTETTAPDTATLPYKWKQNLSRGLRNNRDVFALQIALSKEGIYPPAGFEENECALSGNFGDCTKASVIAFQRKHNFSSVPGTGYVGSYTRKVLNKLYSN